MAEPHPYAYHVVDVFTSLALEGNPLAVFPDARAIGDVTMQRIARELNLSETAFVLPRRGLGDLRVRIFTPAYEMTFAGHPTIGTAAVARRLGIVRSDAMTIVLEEPVGLVTVRVDACDRFWLETPPIVWGETYGSERAAAALGLPESDVLCSPVRRLSAGNPCIFVALESPAAVDRISIDTRAFRRLVASREGPACLFAFAPTPAGAYARMFCEEFDIVEDPATGSATGPLAAYMMHYGLVAHAAGTAFVTEQGTKMGRRSFLHVRIEGERGREAILVGGDVVPIAVATFDFDTACNMLQK